MFAKCGVLDGVRGSYWVLKQSQTRAVKGSKDTVTFTSRFQKACKCYRSCRHSSGKRSCYIKTHSSGLKNIPIMMECELYVMHHSALINSHKICMLCTVLFVATVTSLKTALYMYIWIVIQEEVKKNLQNWNVLFTYI